MYTTEKFRRDNPKTYQAFVEGLAEAASLIHANPDLAADIFMRTNHSNIDRALLLKILRSPELDYKLALQNTFQLADFMYRVGAIKHKPASAKDYVFDDAHATGASRRWTPCHGRSARCPDRDGPAPPRQGDCREGDVDRAAAGRRRDARIRDR